MRGGNCFHSSGYLNRSQYRDEGGTMECWNSQGMRYAKVWRHRVSYGFCKRRLTRREQNRTGSGVRPRGKTGRNCDSTSAMNPQFVRRIAYELHECGSAICAYAICRRCSVLPMGLVGAGIYPVRRCSGGVRLSPQSRSANRILSLQAMAKAGMHSNLS